MESLEALEKKVAQLVGFAQKLKTENSSLAKENAALKKKLDSLERDVLQGHANIELLSEEQQKTKLCVADLIKNIDLLVEGAGQL